MTLYFTLLGIVVQTFYVYQMIVKEIKTVSVQNVFVLSMKIQISGSKVSFIVEF